MEINKLKLKKIVLDYKQSAYRYQPSVAFEDLDFFILKNANSLHVMQLCTRKC